MVDPLAFRDQVAATIRSHRMLNTAEKVLVAVSGGPDSVCLAQVLPTLGFSTALAHVNHALRGPDSEEDEAFVRSLAEELGVGFFSKRAPITLGPGNLEALAREARRTFFDGLLQKHGFQKVALAHSQDDRVETFLLHLVRGSGAPGLTSMRPVSGQIVRPLIETRRTEIEAYLKALGQSFRTDASNMDTGFARNRMRHRVIPELAQRFNPKLVEGLSRTIEILGTESDWLDQAAETWLNGRTERSGNSLVFNINDLHEEPLAIIRRVLRFALRQAGSSLEDLSFEHLEQVRSLLETGKSGKVIEIPGRIQVERNFHTLVFELKATATPDYAHELPIPGRVHIPEIGADFGARFVDPEAAKPNEHKALVDGTSVGPYVKIRNWKSGDVYNPVGLRASKLKYLFQKERISARNRRRWPVVVAGSSIVWVAPFPVSRDFVPTGSSQRIVELEALLSPEMA